MTNIGFSPPALALGQKLLEHHQAVCRGAKIPAAGLTDAQVAPLSIRYGKLCELAGLPFLARSSGGYLYEIAVWCENEGWPPINALVVNESGLPGDGYDRPPGGGYAQWPEQVRSAIAFKGYPDVMPD
jgi:hypothetical protein